MNDISKAHIIQSVTVLSQIRLKAIQTLLRIDSSAVVIKNSRNWSQAQFDMHAWPSADIIDIFEAIDYTSTLKLLDIFKSNIN